MTGSWRQGGGSAPAARPKSQDTEAVAAARDADKSSNADLADNDEILSDEQDAADDAWMDLAETDEAPDGSTARGGFRATTLEAISGPMRRMRRIYHFLATTPGKMAGITVLLSIAIFAAGYSMSQSSADRQEGLDQLLSETEPLSYSAHNLYTNLSLADAIATSGFVRSGADSQSSLDEYFTAVDDASVAGTQTASGISPDEPRLAELITTIQRELPVYTAMVETARTNNRVGNPVGSTYMESASAMMRGDILPDAGVMFSLTGQRVAQEQRELTTPQWVPLSGLVAAVFFLVLAQLWLWRVTRRRLNRGFVAATAFMVLAIVWVSVSNYATWESGSRGFQEASQPWDSLTTSRIQAQQAQTAETLALVRRDSLANNALTFDAMADSVSSALDDMEVAVDGGLGDHRPDDGGDPSATIEEARTALEDWTAAHDRFVNALDSGNYDQAVYLTTTANLTPGAEPTAASAAARLDDALGALIDDARLSMRAFIADGLAATAMVAGAVLLLAFAAVVSVWLGIRARLQEYL